MDLEVYDENCENFIIFNTTFYLSTTRFISNTVLYHCTPAIDKKEPSELLTMS
jgi:hypothetical protein